MELYVHIPFCVKKCRYCDFLSFPLCSVGEDERKKYIDALIRELYLYRETFEQEGCDSVFIGGGTPSVLPPEQMEKLLKSIYEVCLKPGVADRLAYSSANSCVKASGNGSMDTALSDIEFTIECNPGTVDREKLMLYRKYGVNRLSFGLQSADDGELQLLGRIHTYAEFFQSYNLARECGFDNINIDLISAIPGQTVSSWERTLRKAAELKPEHISAYSLIVEPGTPFWDEYGEEAEKIAKGYQPTSDHISLPSEEDEREMYRLTKSVLAEYGYDRYEISNYCLSEKRSKHNLGYWTGVKYVGIGLGASSYVGSDTSKEMLRYHNTDSLEEYLFCQNGKRHVDEVLDESALMSEYVILRLRLTEGFSEQDFYERFHIDVHDVFGESIDKYERQGLLIREKGRIYLSDEGLDVSNTIMADMMP